mmetsp:Transcript_28519/g.39707  ORF Transcript_28519/g.39707 Transcript_28519/m.39707 type:complete len:959 (+) Transcript_28519:32-2908(+)
MALSTKDAEISSNRLVQQPGKPGNKGVGLVIVEDGDWTCPRCHKKNYSNTTTCGNRSCNGSPILRNQFLSSSDAKLFTHRSLAMRTSHKFEKPQTNEEGQTINSSHSLLSSLRNPEWKCETCGEVNSTSNRFCKQCYLAHCSPLRPNSPTEGPSIAAFRGTSLSSSQQSLGAHHNSTAPSNTTHIKKGLRLTGVSKWICPVCQEENSTNSRHCQTNLCNGLQPAPQEIPVIDEVPNIREISGVLKAARGPPGEYLSHSETNIEHVHGARHRPEFLALSETFHHRASTGAQQPPQQSVERLQGRKGWTCERCGNFNFYGRTVCNIRSCRAPCPSLHGRGLHLTGGGGAAAPSGQKEERKGWTCGECGNFNYQSRRVCNIRTCRAPRPSAIPLSLSPSPNQGSFRSFGPLIDEVGPSKASNGQYGSYPIVQHSQHSRTHSGISTVSNYHSGQNDHIGPHTSMANGLGQSTNGRNDNKEERKGWTCQECGNFNYQSRRVCNIRTCRAPRPFSHQQNSPPPISGSPTNPNMRSNHHLPHPSLPVQSGQIHNAPAPQINGHANSVGSQHKGGWNCPRCGNFNFTSRNVCNMRRCRLPRPTSEGNGALPNGVGLGPGQVPMPVPAHQRPGGLACETNLPRNGNVSSIREEDADGNIGWTCQECGNFNFESRRVCNRRRCRAPRYVSTRGWKHQYQPQAAKATHNQRGPSDECGAVPHIGQTHGSLSGTAPSLIGDEGIHIPRQQHGMHATQENVSRWTWQDGNGNAPSFFQKQYEEQKKKKAATINTQHSSFSRASPPPLNGTPTGLDFPLTSLSSHNLGAVRGNIWDDHDSEGDLNKTSNAVAPSILPDGETTNGHRYTGSRVHLSHIHADLTATFPSQAVGGPTKSNGHSYHHSLRRASEATIKSIGTTALHMSGLSLRDNDGGGSSSLGWFQREGNREGNNAMSSVFRNSGNLSLTGTSWK